MHAFEVSFDRPFDQQEFYNMVTELELPWVRFLERNGIDVSYQTDGDTDRVPGSLLHHRLVFAIGHDEYWTLRMRGAFNRALALSANLMFGSNSGEWRMRYAAGRRTIVEWRDPSIDPVPSCLAGQVVPLMTALIPGSDGVPRSADMVRATAPSGGRVFAMGTMELAWALDDLDGRSPNPQVVAFVKAALRDLTRPAPPAALIIRHRATELIASARLRAPDQRILRVIVRPVRGGRGCADSLRSVCRLPLPRRTTRYAAVAIDQWRASQPLTVTVQPGNDLRTRHGS